MKRPDVNRPLVFAHRGASRVAPENTLPAFEMARRLGADGVELDVQYTSDGKLVVMHNPELDATTSGAGRVTAHTLDEIRTLDAGAWFGAEFAGTRVPLLEEVLDLLRGSLLVNIEIKVLAATTATLGEEVVRLVRDRDMQDQVVISSFNPFALRRAKKAGPEIECALLLAPELPAWMRSALIRRHSRATALHPEAPMVDAPYMARARAANLPVRVWTVNEPDEMRRFAALGVDAIITDTPDTLLSVLNAAA